MTQKTYVNKNYTGATQTCTEVEQMMAAGTGVVVTNFQPANMYGTSFPAMCHIFSFLLNV